MSNEKAVGELMEKEIEIEFKNLLTHTEFKRLQEAFHIQETDFMYLTNHYFETPLFALKATHSALRIRQKNNDYTITLKQPHTDGLLESNVCINEEEAKNLLAGIRPFPDEIIHALEELNIDGKSLRHFGSLMTKRVEQKYEDGLLVLDESSYFDVTDFELEFEATSVERGEQQFNELLKKYSITKRPSSPKIRRFNIRKIELEAKK